ncbi:uncharacterized protein [Watersipora subatra]|uniref:uncharacterized protein isoform X1 n=1 Tax=Watersipora subatra TaxID=2589382 RepID=UPI00355BC83E
MAMMRRGGNRGQTFLSHARGRGGSSGRGQRFRSNSNMTDGDSREFSLDVANSHQCNNLSFETKDPATKDSRIYVGNICKRKVTRSDLFVIFSKYGTITAISHLSSRNPSDYCSFAFVQYTTVESAERAVHSENGHGYYGYALDVKLADFKADLKSSGSFPSAPPRVTSTSQSGPLFKRSASSQDNSIPSAKKPKIDDGSPPDILVCGTCHLVFKGIEAMIVHKREPCKSVKKCRCSEENIPDVLCCAICFKKVPSPWQLILHTHRVHNISICTNLTDDMDPTDQDGIDEDDFRDSTEVGDAGVEAVDLENDLIDEEQE